MTQSTTGPPTTATAAADGLRGYAAKPAGTSSWTA